MQIFLNIIYFLLALTVLVSIHEAGHLAMAKLFNVYCDEYSIGFGPKIYQHVPKGVDKNGKPKETKFTIRCLPLGGYVTMAGEGMEDMEEYKNLPKERFLNNVAKWKRALIMVAGVVLNAILGLILLIVAYSIIPANDYRSTCFDVADTVSYTYYDLENQNGKTVDAYTSPAKEAGLTSTTELSKVVIVYEGEVVDTITSTLEEYYTANPDVVKGSDNDPYTYVSLQDGKYVVTYNVVAGTLTEKGGTYAVITDAFNSFSPKASGDIKTYKLYGVDGKEYNLSVDTYQSSISITNGVATYGYSWKLIGISSITRGRGFGEIMSNSFSTFGEYSIAIYKAIGQLFTGTGFENLGGPIAIVQQQMTFASNGIGYFLLFWGLISINLAVINLLPFPGLDGWHFLVIIVEAITRREMPQKVKSIMSLVGLVLLFGLMIAITCKDIFNLFVVAFSLM